MYQRRMGQQLSRHEWVHTIDVTAKDKLPTEVEFRKETDTMKIF